MDVWDAENQRTGHSLLSPKFMMRDAKNLYYPAKIPGTRTPSFLKHSHLLDVFHFVLYRCHVRLVPRTSCHHSKLFLPVSLLLLGIFGTPYKHKRLQSHTGHKNKPNLVTKEYFFNSKNKLKNYQSFNSSGSFAV